MKKIILIVFLTLHISLLFFACGDKTMSNDTLDATSAPMSTEMEGNLELFLQHGEGIHAENAVRRLDELGIGEIETLHVYAVGDGIYEGRIVNTEGSVYYFLADEEGFITAVAKKDGTLVWTNRALPGPIQSGQTPTTSEPMLEIMEQNFFRLLDFERPIHAEQAARVFYELGIGLIVDITTEDEDFFVEITNDQGQVYSFSVISSGQENEHELSTVIKGSVRLAGSLEDFVIIWSNPSLLVSEII